MDREVEQQDPWSFSPIGTFHTRAVRPYEAPRQATIGAERGIITLLPHRMHEQALIGLEGFERIWILYLFHHNSSHWKPMVQPPRSLSGEKYGVFATRAPYRPNPIGLSCTRLVAVRGLNIEVEGSDLLDGTPILDIKPYIPYADAFPNAAAGWLDRLEPEQHSIERSAVVDAKIQWLSPQLNLDLVEFLEKHLLYLPTDSRHKRVRRAEEENLWILSLRTWRFLFRIDPNHRAVAVLDLFSGYTADDLIPQADDPFGDKNLHRAFVAHFPESALPERLQRHRHK